MEQNGQTNSLKGNWLNIRDAVAYSNISERVLKARITDGRLNVGRTGNKNGNLILIERKHLDDQIKLGFPLVDYDFEEQETVVKSKEKNKVMKIDLNDL